MGILVESCTSCTKKDEKDEKNGKEEESANNSFPKYSTTEETKELASDKKCKGEITIIEKESDFGKRNSKIHKSSIIIFNNLKDNSPFESYKEVQKITSDTILVSDINDSDNKRLMIIIDIKDIVNDKNKKKELIEDIKDLERMDHPNLNKIFEVYIYEGKIYLICYNPEDDIIKKIKKEKKVEDEKSINIIMNQILNSISYLHKNEIFNIGLKLDKIFINEIILQNKKSKIERKNKSKDNNIESQKKENEESKEKKNIKKQIDVKLLTLGYLNENYDLDKDSLIFYPPQVIEEIEKNNLKKNKYENEKIDEWGCGILMYFLITGEFPFKGEGKEFNSNIKNTVLNLTSPKFDLISDSCVDLLKKLLEKDVNKRINSEDSLNHPFFTGESFIKEEENQEIDLEILKDLLKLTKPKSKFHELINAYLCFNFLDKDEEKKLSNLFRYIDQNHDNVISDEDIIIAFKKNDITYTEEQIKNILNVFDYDQNNLIQYQEFLRVLCNKEKLYNNKNMESVFKAIDTDNNQYINIEDIRRFVPNDEETKNKIEKEFMEPFGMKNEEKMIFSQFCEVIMKNKTYADVNNVKSRIEKAKLNRKINQQIE